MDRKKEKALEMFERLFASSDFSWD